MRPLFVFSIVATSLCIGCGGGSGGASPVSTPLPPVTFAHSFPSGNASAVSGTAWDIVGVTTTIETQPGVSGLTKYDYLRVDVTFAQNVQNALPDPGTPLSAGDQIGVQVNLDNDGNPLTGTFAACNYASSRLDPFEYSTDQGNDPGRLSDGNYSIIGPNSVPIALGSSNLASEANVTVAANTISFGFYRPLVQPLVNPFQKSAFPLIHLTALLIN